MAMPKFDIFRRRNSAEADATVRVNIPRAETEEENAPAQPYGRSAFVPDPGHFEPGEIDIAQILRDDPDDDVPNNVLSFPNRSSVVETVPDVTGDLIPSSDERFFHNVPLPVVPDYKTTLLENDAAIVEKRQRLIEQSRLDLEQIQRTLRERLAEQSGFLNRLRKIYESVTGTAKAIRAHMQDVDNALKLTARTNVADTDVRSIRLVVKQMQETYGITPAPATAHSAEARPAALVQNEVRVAVAPIAEPPLMTDLSSEQAQFKLFFDASILLRQAQNNPDRNSALTQAASGMAQVNKLIERLVVTSRGKKFQIPLAVAELISTVHTKVEPMLQSINPKADHYTIVTAGKTLGVEFARFTQFAENYIESIPVPSEAISVQPVSVRQVEPRSQLSQLFEAMLKSHSSHLQEAVRAQQPERVVRVIQDINRFLASSDININDIPNNALADIDNQLDWAKAVCANNTAYAEQMRNAERTFKLFALGQAKSKANYKGR